MLLTAFVVLFYGPWQEACTDFARQIVFEQRDKLFDMAREGRMKFDSNEYRTIRISMENMIRFAHELTLPRLIYMSFFIRNSSDRGHTSILVAVANVKDEHVRNDIVELLNKSYLTLIVMMAFKSLICVALLPIIAITGAVARAFGTISSACKTYVMKTGELIQLEAECA